MSIMYMIFLIMHLNIITCQKTCYNICAVMDLDLWGSNSYEMTDETHRKAVMDLDLWGSNSQEWFGYNLIAL